MALKCYKRRLLLNVYYCNITKMGHFCYEMAIFVQQSNFKIHNENENDYNGEKFTIIWQALFLHFHLMVRSRDNP